MEKNIWFNAEQILMTNTQLNKYNLRYMLPLYIGEYIKCDKIYYTCNEPPYAQNSLIML